MSAPIISAGMNTLWVSPLLSAMRSKDDSSQVGACIVSPENKILSLGYNGMPIGCSDDEMPLGARRPAA